MLNRDKISRWKIKGSNLIVVTPRIDTRMRPICENDLTARKIGSTSRTFARVCRHAYTRTRVAIGLMYYAMTLPGRNDDGAECLEARVSVGGPCASRRCSPPGGLHVSGTRLHRLPPFPAHGILSSARRCAVPTPRNCWNYYFIAATRAGESPAYSIHIPRSIAGLSNGGNLSLIAPDSVISDNNDV